MLLAESFAKEIPWLRMLGLYLFLALPIFLMWHLHIPMIKKLIIAAMRMTLQLTLVGLYLGYLFELDNLWLNGLWLITMIAVAAGHILKSSNLRQKPLFMAVFAAVAGAMLIVLTPFIAAIIKPEKFYDARYLIPLGGMLLGNFLSANIVALNHYSQCLSKRKQSLQAALCSGASRHEAVLPFVRQAFQRAITPTITTIGTLGLVSLPGMMTGQLLGGSFPKVAIQYQIAIMIAIVSACALSIYFTLYFITNHFFDNRDNIRNDLFMA